ncbi:universal stress protein [Halogranum gelatinilyticum]|nr:universal stress protein [Halogranum gelatinilyticum]
MALILLATDGSVHSLEAARHAIDLATEGDHSLHVLSVVDSRKFDEPALSTGELATIDAEDHGYEHVSRIVTMATAAGISVDATTCHGVPHECILEYATDLDADRIVLGAHGEHREHLGGVGRQVEASASCAVDVVDAGA